MLSFNDRSWMMCTMGGGGLFGGSGDSCGMDNSTVTATVDQSFTRGKAFAQWLQKVGASSSLGQPAIDQARHNFDAVHVPLSERWLYTPSEPLHYTFDTPVGAAAGHQCGCVLFSDFHVNASMGGGHGGHGGGGGSFPAECDSNPMPPQEKALEFMLFDLSSCVPPAGKM